MIDVLLKSIIKAASDAINNEINRVRILPPEFIGQMAIDFVNCLVELIICMKNENFIEENEWRIIIAKSKNGSEDETNNDVKFRERQNEIIPYLPIQIYNQNNNREFPLRSIKIGPMLEADKENYSLKLFLKSLSSKKNEVYINPNDVEITDAGYVLRK